MSFYSKVIDQQKLNMAWEKVKRNKPAGGVDNVTWELFEEGRKEEIKRLNLELLQREYVLQPVRMATLYKGEKPREVALYCMRDKVVQQSVANELVKCYEAFFPGCVYAYRPGKSALEAVERIAEAIKRKGFTWVLKMDIEHFFDTICIETLIRQLRQRIVEEDLLDLIQKICTAPSLSVTGELAARQQGIHQGSAVAPVLSNIYLIEFDHLLEQSSPYYVRYSDDMIVLGKEKEELELVLAKARQALEPLGLALNQDKTVIRPLEEGVEFLGYQFHQNGKTIPVKAKINLMERLEMMWLTESGKTIQDKLKKGAEIVGGWEQYFREEREIASIYEFVVFLYMGQNKGLSPTILEEQRKTVGNTNKEICLYLYEHWRKLPSRFMMLYEAEDFYGIAELDLDIKLESVYLEELLSSYESLLVEESEEQLVNIMQIYSDTGFLRKAAAFMDKLTRFQNSKKSLPFLGSIGKEKEDRGEEVHFTEEQLKEYIVNFIGREDAYMREEVGSNNRRGFGSVSAPLTEEVLQKHFLGECTVGTYVQRNNGTAKYMVIDIDISKKVLLELEGDLGKLQPYMQRAANCTRKIQNGLKQMGFCSWVEESGYRGYHIWILFTEWISVRYLNLFQDVIEERIGEVPEAIAIEFFPNKTQIKNGKLGQAIKLPYGYHTRTGKQSRFLDENFVPVQKPGELMLEMGKYKYTNAALKRVLSMAIPKAAVMEKEHTVDPDLQGFGRLSENVELVLNKCNLMRYLCQKARTTGYLSHFERLSVLYVFGHMGEEGAAFVHKIMEFTLNYQYSVTERFISRIPPKPVSCIKLRDQYQKITAEYGCNCRFSRAKNCYPSPVLHAIRSGDGGQEDVTLPTSRTISKDREDKVYEELNIKKRVEAVTEKILEMKKQKRGIDKNITKLEHELEAIFDEAKINCLEVEFGMLVRRKKEEGYEWIVEI